MTKSTVCSQLCFRHMIAIILLPLFCAEGINYTWLEFNDVFDGAVVITLDEKPIATGVFVTWDAICTSANAVERIEDPKRLAVYSINGHYLKSVRKEVFSINKDQFNRNSKHWRPFGFDNRHSPLFDVLLVALEQDTDIYNPPYRSPRQFLRPRVVFPLIKTETISFASFGFIDKLHLRESKDLEMAEYVVGDVQVDCDEWIPRAWGYYLCFLNVENFACNGAGAPLWYRNSFIGLGAFTVTKGNDSILVFTDMRVYTWLAFVHPATHKG